MWSFQKNMASSTSTSQAVSHPESSNSAWVKESFCNECPTCPPKPTKICGSKFGSAASVVKLREIKKPDLTPLRSIKLQLKMPGKEGVEKFQDDGSDTCGSYSEIPVPASWRESTPDIQEIKFSVKNKDPVEEAPQSDELTLEEKMKILKEQEGCVPNAGQFRAGQKVKVNKNAADVRGVPDWIKKSLEVSSSVGHLEELDSIKPMSSILRVAVPPVVNAPERINQQEQMQNLEKGGHAAIRDKRLDYSVLAESMERQKNACKINNGAWMLLCKGILHDNAQEYYHALEDYKKCLELFKETGDMKGEAMIYNFMACSLQEDQDLKLSASQRMFLYEKPEISTSAIIQYENAAEYHKKHAEIADLEGKFKVQDS